MADFNIGAFGSAIQRPALRPASFQGLQEGIEGEGEGEGSLAYYQGLQEGIEGEGAGSLAYYQGRSEGVGGATVPSGLQGSLFEGFNVPVNNGTGDLIPDISDREDAIEGSNFKSYFA
ncbi:hypothetical protein IJ531_00530 [bacterium]|nr:hypothetical protein [bacterium]